MGCDSNGTGTEAFDYKASQAAKEVRKHIIEGLKNYKGDLITTEHVRDAIAKIGESTAKVPFYSQIKCEILWKTMGWKGRLEWWFMKTFFSKEVKEMVHLVDKCNSVMWKYNAMLGERNSSLDIPISYTNYPNWCHPNPKSVVTTSMVLNRPINYATINFTVGDKE